MSTSSPGRTFRPDPSPGSIDLGKILEYLNLIVADRFFGVIQLSFQSGQCVNLRSEQSFKSPELSNLIATRKGTRDGRSS